MCKEKSFKETKVVSNGIFINALTKTAPTINIIIHCKVFIKKNTRISFYKDLVVSLINIIIFFEKLN